MYSAIDTSIHVIWIYKACQEGDGIDPAALVEERSPHHLCWLEVGARSGQTCYHQSDEARYGDDN